MWQKNDEIIAKDEIQFRFTNYLLTAIRRKRKDYLSKICSCMEHEVVIDELLYQSDKAEYDELNTFMLMQRLDNTSLWHALSDLSERELYVLLERIVEEKTFSELSEELGLRYKGISAIYYRTIKKIRAAMKGDEKVTFDQLLQDAKNGSNSAVTKILQIYRPLLIKNSIVRGRFDEDLYQELCLILLKCIKQFEQ